GINIISEALKYIQLSNEYNMFNDLLANISDQIKIEYRDVDYLKGILTEYEEKADIDKGNESKIPERIEDNLYKYFRHLR
ncbi:MAG: hypothetical protein ACFFDN_45500, partial [Candidatus Hodarchaeota archaeon]